jgi:tryprostatin B 6-hydroxylase
MSYIENMALLSVSVCSLQCYDGFQALTKAGPSSVSICDPQALEAVHGARSRCRKSAMYDISLPFTTLQQMRDRPLHDKRRRTGGWDEAFSAKGE